MADQYTNMDLGYGLQSGSGQPAIPAPPDVTIEEQVTISASSSLFGRYSELPPTRAMKTLVKNTTAKFGRLQDRLLKYAELCTDPGATDFGAQGAEKLKVAKCLFQYRLVDIQRVRKD